MRLLKQDVINKLAEKTGLYKKDVRAVLDSFYELVYEELDADNSILITNLFKVDARIIRGKAVASVYIDVDYMSNYYGVTGQQVATWANEGLHGGKNLATNTPHVWDETMANTVDNGALIRDAVAYLRSQGFTVKI